MRVLSGAPLEDASIALRRAAEEIATRSGVHIRFDTTGSYDLCPDAIASLSRIVREACSNAVRHGQAKQIVVRTEAQNGGCLRVSVSDDGVGFDSGTVAGNGGFGLRSMHERALALGGDLKLTSTFGEGTTVEVVVPLTPVGSDGHRVGQAATQA
ncbi:MAG: sensor histidine kinase [Pseudonocardiaceae bacterium]